MTEPAPIELYACMTPNVLKVLFMLGETGVPYRLRHVRIYRAEHFAPGFEALHPNRKLPVIVDPEGPDGGPHTVFESGAILVYLAEKTGRLAGADAAERSRALQWLMLQMSSVGPMFGQAMYFRRPALTDQPEARARYMTQVMRLLEVYERRLGEAPWLAGDGFTLADVATFPWLWKHPGMLGIDLAPYANLRRWIADIETRPGLQRAHQPYREIVREDRADAAAADDDFRDRFFGRGRWTLPGSGETA